MHRPARRRHHAPVLAAALIGALTPAVVADETAGLRGPWPVFWAWQEPIGAATNLPNVIQLLRPDIRGMSGGEAADWVCDRILERGLRPGEIGICLQNFGEEDAVPLWRHPDDGVGGLHTPWMTHGIAPNRAWSVDFTTRYLHRQELDTAIPNPDRFHFDTEHLVTVSHPLQPTVAFDLMRGDPRWDDEAIVGYGGTKTMADLWAEAGSPVCDPTQGYFEPVNREWANWYAGICMTAADAAMKKAAYSRFRLAWPDADCSNWWSSAGFDGAGDPPRLFVWRGPDWFSYAWKPSGHVQAPICYWARASETLPGETDVEAALRHATAKIDACRLSWTENGVPNTNIAPWIERVGNTRDGRRVVRDLQEPMLAMMVERGVREVIVWSDGGGSQNADDWSLFAEIVVSIGAGEMSLPEEEEQGDPDGDEPDEPERDRPAKRTRGDLASLDVDPAPALGADAPRGRRDRAAPPAEERRIVVPGPTRDLPGVAAGPEPPSARVARRQGTGSGGGFARAPRRIAAAEPAPAAPAWTDPSPMFWSWQPPLGEAADLPFVTRLVIEKSDRGTPEEVADRVCDAIRSRGLVAGRVGIVLQNFGMGDGDPESGAVAAPALFKHHDDALPHRARGGVEAGGMIAARDAAAKWWETLWMRRGIAESRDWLDRFVARYRARQAGDARIPDPDRFHFDSEGRVVPWRKGMTEVFDAMRRDPRFGAEPIPGFEGRTLADLWEEAGRPECDPLRDFHHGPNRAWATWYASICMTAAEAAMDEAAYAPIRAAWPTCRSSNYGTSDRYDGAGDPPRLRRDNRHDWLRFAYSTKADLQAPVCYLASEAFALSDETIEEATLRRAQLKLDANVRSHGGPHDDVVPWIEAVGNVRVRGGERVAMAPGLARDLLALARSRGVHEFILWSDDSTQRTPRGWNDFVAVIGAVWAFAPESARPEVGSGVVAPAAVFRADGVVAEVHAARDVAEPASPHVARSAYRFRKRRRGFEPGVALEIAVESRMDQPHGELVVMVRHPESGAVVTLGAARCGPDAEPFRLRVDPSDAWIDAEGRLEIVVEHRNRMLFVASTDLVAVTEASRADPVGR